MKQILEEAKAAWNELRGKMKELVSRLKEEFGVDNVKSAKKLIDEKQAKLDKVDDRLEQGVEKLEENYAWEM